MNLLHTTVNVLKVIDTKTVEGYNILSKTIGKYEVCSTNNTYGYTLITGVKIKENRVVFIKDNEYSIELELEDNVVNKANCNRYTHAYADNCTIDHGSSEITVTQDKNITFKYNTSSIFSNALNINIDIDLLNESVDIDDYNKLPVTYSKLEPYNKMLNNKYYIDRYIQLLKIINTEKQVKNLNVTCVVCNEKPPTYLMKDCSHLCLCEECQENVTKCPMCRKTSEKIKVYY